MIRMISLVSLGPQPSLCLPLDALLCVSSPSYHSLNLSKELIRFLYGFLLSFYGYLLYYFLRFGLLCSFPQILTVRG